MALFSIIEAFGKNLHLPWRFHDEIKTINVRLDGANYRYWLIFKEKCGYLPMPIFYTMQDNFAKALSNHKQTNAKIITWISNTIT